MATANDLVSPKDQKLAEKVLGKTSDAVTNEGNLLSLITLKQILGDEDPNGKEVKEILRGAAKEETRYLMQAMKILTGDIPDDIAPEVKAGYQRLRGQYGQDMAGALKLGEVLKAKASDKELELLYNPFVLDTIRNKNHEHRMAGGFKVPKKSSLAIFEKYGKSDAAFGRSTVFKPF